MKLNIKQYLMIKDDVPVQRGKLGLCNGHVFKAVLYGGENGRG